MFDSDDEDFSFSPSSNLSSIFNVTSTTQDANSSLKYKAPKQPKLQDIGRMSESEISPENSTPPQPTVIFAKVITLWKLDNGENKTIGKYMVAIIGNPSKDISELIVYQEKTKIIIREILGKSFTLYKYPNNFVSFHDKQKQLWNLCFDSSENKDAFLQYSSKYNCVLIDKTTAISNRNENSDMASNKHQESDATPSILNKELTSKERILSRITKMGKPILPRNIRNSELSDSETESSVSDPMPPAPIAASRKLKRNVNNHEKALASIVPESHNNFTHLPSNNNFLVPNNQMILNPHNPIYPQPMPDYGLSNFIIAQNAELKANLAEINAKLNNVLSSSDRNGNNMDNASSLASKIKCQNLKIDNLSTELDRSRKELEKLHKKYNDKCEEFNKGQAQILQSENIKLELTILQKRLEDMEILEGNLEEFKTELKEKNKQVEIRDLKLKDFEEYYKTNQLAKESFLKENADLKQKYEETLLKLHELEDKDNLSLINNQSLNLDKDNINRIVKESMNEAFLNIMGSFDENETYDCKHIQGVLLDNLKKTSYRLMNSLL